MSHQSGLFQKRESNRVGQDDACLVNLGAEQRALAGHGLVRTYVCTYVCAHFCTGQGRSREQWIFGPDVRTAFLKGGGRPDNLAQSWPLVTLRRRVGTVEKGARTYVRVRTDLTFAFRFAFLGRPGSFSVLSTFSFFFFSRPSNKNGVAMCSNKYGAKSRVQVYPKARLSLHVPYVFILKTII